MLQTCTLLEAASLTCRLHANISITNEDHLGTAMFGRLKYAEKEMSVGVNGNMDFLSSSSAMNTCAHLSRSQRNPP